MGNGQFERIYCNEYEVPFMEKKNDPHIWDSLFDENRRPLYTEFDPADLIDFHPFEIIGVPDGYRFDLGQGYEVELVHLPGHSAGMSGFIDHCNVCFVILSFDLYNRIVIIKRIPPNF
jgi:glyoxylase-like metal-dependent hydrolase (beta-lactamase superfamily II)